MTSTPPAPAETIGRWNNHHNDIGDWCPFSYVQITISRQDTHCPAGCADSTIEADVELPWPSSQPQRPAGRTRSTS
jgi:hypothetical protein